MTRPIPAALSLALLMGCSDMELAGANDMAAYDDSGLYPDATLRVDVFPPFDLGGGDLLEQSFFLDFDGSQERSISLDAPVQLTANVSGYDASTQPEVDIPGGDTPVDGLFTAMVPGTPMVVQAGIEGGKMVTRLNPSEDYVFAWVPSSPVELPMLVVEQEVLRDRDEVVKLDYAQPVYGEILDGQGGSIDGVAVQLVHSATGLEGPLTSARNGSYVLRAYPGEYELRVAGQDSRYLPTQVIPLVVADTGVRQDISYGSTDTTFVGGEVQDGDGQPMRNVTVRFRSVELTGTPAGTLDLDATSDTNGLFQVKLTEGRYDVEYVPPSDSEWGPATGDALVVSAEQALVPTLKLPPRPRVQAYVVAPDGQPISGALVRAKELAFEGATYETTTSEAGTFTLPVSDTELSWTITPPAGVEAAITHFEGDPWTIMEREELQLEVGDLVSAVIDFEGEPAAFTSVELRDSTDRLLGSVLTDADGRFSTRVVLP